MIPHNQPHIIDKDIAAVTETIRSGYIAHGPRVEELEHAFVEFYGGGGACGCSSGTAALFLALKGLGLERGDRVSVPSYTCSAVLNAVYMTGADPVVVDVKPEDFTIDPISVAERAPKAKAALAVHTYGAEADVKSLKEVIPLVVEDCCHSLGGKTKRRPIGTDGDAAIFSFYATKIITCGHGGLIWDPTDKVAEWIRDYRNFDFRKRYKPRFNFHLSDIQAAMAIAQFGRIMEIAHRRREIADKYRAALKKGVKVQAGLTDPDAMIYRFVLILEDEKTRDTLKQYLLDNGIVAAIPIERFELLHRYLGLNPEDFPIAEKLADTTLSIPLYPALNDDQVDLICEKLSMAGTI